MKEIIYEVENFEQFIHCCIEIGKRLGPDFTVNSCDNPRTLHFGVAITDPHSSPIYRVYLSVSKVRGHILTRTTFNTDADRTAFVTMIKMAARYPIGFDMDKAIVNDSSLD